nr:metallophosphoesterase [Sphingomonas chungangi]
MAAALLATVGAAPAPVHRIVAVGDLHGDFAEWRAIATAAGLIDAKGDWAGGDTVLVQTGDVVDRGPDSLDILTDLMRMQKQAPKAGGRVITLVGNHEAMNVTDDLRYVSAGDYAAFATKDSAALRDRLYEANKSEIEAAYRRKDPAMTPDAIRQAWIAATPLGMIEHQQAWHPEGRIGRWVANNPAVVLIDGTLFVHGGIGAAYDQLPIDQINRKVDDALRARDQADGAIINDPLGPLWYRGLVSRDADPDAPKPLPGAPQISIDQELDQVLAAYGAKRMVIAHTPNLAGITVTHDGKLIRIDTGISAYYGGVPSYLEILDGRLVPHAVPRTQGGGSDNAHASKDDDDRGRVAGAVGAPGG